LSITLDKLKKDVMLTLRIASVSLKNNYAMCKKYQEQS